MKNKKPLPEKKMKDKSTKKNKSETPVDTTFHRVSGDFTMRNQGSPLFSGHDSTNKKVGILEPLRLFYNSFQLGNNLLFNNIKTGTLDTNFLGFADYLRYRDYARNKLRIDDNESFIQLFLLNFITPVLTGIFAIPGFAYNLLDEIKLNLLDKPTKYLLDSTKDSNLVVRFFGKIVPFVFSLASILPEFGLQLAKGFITTFIIFPINAISLGSLGSAWNSSAWFEGFIKKMSFPFKMLAKVFYNTDACPIYLVKSKSDIQKNSSIEDDKQSLENINKLKNTNKIEKSISDSLSEQASIDDTSKLTDKAIRDLQIVKGLEKFTKSGGIPDRDKSVSSKPKGNHESKPVNVEKDRKEMGDKIIKGLASRVNKKQ